MKLIFAVFSLYTHMLVSLTGCFTSGVIDRLGMGAVPYVVLLVVPVLGRMSDQCEDVYGHILFCHTLGI